MSLTVVGFRLRRLGLVFLLMTFGSTIKSESSENTLKDLSAILKFPIETPNRLKIGLGSIVRPIGLVSHISDTEQTEGTLLWEEGLSLNYESGDTKEAYINEETSKACLWYKRTQISGYPAHICKKQDTISIDIVGYVPYSGHITPTFKRIFFWGETRSEMDTLKLLSAAMSYIYEETAQ